MTKSPPINRLGRHTRRVNPSLIAVFSSVPDRRSAGRMPAKTATTIDPEIANASTCPLMAGSGNRAMRSGAMTQISGVIHRQRPNARFPPTPDNNRLSASNCRRIRDLLAPSAVRIANSLVRPMLRACWREAKFTQAMRSTRVAAAINKTRPCRTGRTSS